MDSTALVATTRPSKRLGERLLEAGYLSQTQLDLALREQKRRGGLIGQVFVGLGFVSQEIISSFLANEADTRLINVNRYIIDKSVLELVPFETAKRLKALPLSRSNGTLTVALADPFDVVAIDTLQQVTGLTADVVTASERDILNGLELHYGIGESIEQSIEHAMDQQGRETVRTTVTEGVSVNGEPTVDAPIIRLVDQIITRAVSLRASDIHFEPEEKTMRIRMRIDGILYQDVLVPKSMQAPVIARLKIMAELDVTEQRLPQDGRATIFAGRREINLRVSSLPTAHGENVVLRILDGQSQAVGMEALGFSERDLREFRAAVHRPFGVVLVTGPTGSGKTTTLYAVLREISSLEVSTFTLEDPIEYRMPLIRQTQIKEEIGLTFGTGLRALLRQDPDVILVGECRDTETAQLMIRAALTGHLVFSTLHTNDAAGAIPRLVDMGVEPYLLPAALVAVLAQRLVRTICRDCKRPVENPAAVFSELRIQPPAGATLQLWKGAGCPECKNSGYRGRQAVFELMIPGEHFHDPIVHRAGAPEYFRLAREGGMQTMFEDGLRKALSGTTTIEEVLEATRQSND